MKRPSVNLTNACERKSVIGVCQCDNEPVVSHCRRIVDSVKVTESQWGLIVPNKMVVAN